MIYSFEIMLAKTIEFYNSLDISFPEDKNELAVASLTSSESIIIRSLRSLEKIS